MTAYTSKYSDKGTVYTIKYFLSQIFGIARFGISRFSKPKTAYTAKYSDKGTAYTNKYT